MIVPKARMQHPVRRRIAGDFSVDSLDARALKSPLCARTVMSRAYRDCVFDPLLTTKISISLKRGSPERVIRETPQESSFDTASRHFLRRALARSGLSSERCQQLRE